MLIALPFRGPPYPQASIDAGERAAGLYLYSGVAVVAAATVETKGRRPQQIFTIAKPSGIDLLEPLFPTQVAAFIPAPVDVRAEVGLEAIHVFVVPRILSARTDAHAVAHGWRVGTVTGAADASTAAGARAAPYTDSELLMRSMVEQASKRDQDTEALAILGVTL